MLKILEINESKICCFAHPGVYTGEYYKYCVGLLSQVLTYVHKPVNVILGDMDFQFHNKNKTIRLDIQSEHTLVVFGGRSVDEIVWGNIDLMDGVGQYLIRIPNYKYYAGLDGTIEYSMPNIVNIGTNGRYDDYLRKAAYVAPIIYDLVDFKKKTQGSTITMFSSNPSDRRSEFLAKASKNITNVQGVFDREDLRRVYTNSKIMINIHQTDHHHTFEELRVLPALSNGVIIVSEDVPLKDTIPYGNSIIWAPYKDLPDVVKDVQENYEFYHEKVFTDALKDDITNLRSGNYSNLTDLIHKISE